MDVILQDCTSHKLIAKARYTEQAPHQIRARATAYLNNAATAARSAVQRLHTAAEHALQRADGASAAAQSDSDKGSDIRHKAMASLTAAGATVRAAAHRLQLAADSALRSSSADGDSGEARNRNPDDPQVGRPQFMFMWPCQAGIPVQKIVFVTYARLTTATDYLTSLHHAVSDRTLQIGCSCCLHIHCSASLAAGNLVPYFRNRSTGKDCCPGCDNQSPGSCTVSCQCFVIPSARPSRL